MPDKGQRAREIIIEAARDLFYRQGYGATSYADISGQTGYGKGNIHYYFKSKEEVLRAVTELRLANYQNFLDQWAEECAAPYDCLERFITMFENNAPNLARYGCPMGTLNGELGKDAPHLQEDTRAMFDLFLAWLEARFRELLPARQAKDKAEQLLVMAQGIAVMAHAYKDEDLVKRQAGVVRDWLAKTCADK